MSLPLNINFQQILLHMFNLCLLFGGLYLLLYKPVKKFMDDRAAKYKYADDAANEKLLKAQEAEALAQQKLKDCEIKIEQDIAKSRADAEAEAESIIKDANNTKKQILAAAEEAALREKNRMINDAREEIAELAVKAAEKVISEKAEKKVKSDD